MWAGTAGELGAITRALTICPGAPRARARTYDPHAADLPPLPGTDQARSDFAAIERDFKFVMNQLAQLPTRAYLCRMLLLSTASLWALLGAVALWMR
jgi:hypothetical protein